MSEQPNKIQNMNLKKDYIPKPVSDKAVEVFEQYFDFKLPEDYKQFLKKYGGESFGPVVLGLDDNIEKYHLSIDYFLRIRRTDDGFYDSIICIDYKQWYAENGLDLDDPEDYTTFLEIIGNNPKKRVIIARYGGYPFLTIAEDGEIERWNPSADGKFRHVANSFTEFLNSFSRLED
jgi:SMI1 / KNR4 family (SUKH-1)